MAPSDVKPKAPGIKGQNGNQVHDGEEVRKLDRGMVLSKLSASRYRNRTVPNGAFLWFPFKTSQEVGTPKKAKPLNRRDVCPRVWSGFGSSCTDPPPKRVLWKEDIPKCLSSVCSNGDTTLLQNLGRTKSCLETSIQRECPKG